MNRHPVADNRTILNGNIGMDDGIISDGHVIADDDPRLQPNAISESDMISDNCYRANRNIVAVLEIPTDRCRWVDALEGFDRRVKKPGDPGKRHHRVVDLDQIQLGEFGVRRDDYRRRPAISNSFQKLGGAGYGDIRAAGQFKGRDTVDWPAVISTYTALHHLRQETNRYVLGFNQFQAPLGLFLFPGGLGIESFDEIIGNIDRPG
jgi:hypothetical protein